MGAHMSRIVNAYSGNVYVLFECTYITGQDNRSNNKNYNLGKNLLDFHKKFTEYSLKCAVDTVKLSLNRVNDKSSYEEEWKTDVDKIRERSS